MNLHCTSSCILLSQHPEPAQIHGVKPHGCTNLLAFCHLTIAELLGADFQPADWQRWSLPEGTGSVLFLCVLRICSFALFLIQSFGNSYMFFFTLMCPTFKMLTVCSAFCILSFVVEPNISLEIVLKIFSSNTTEVLHLLFSHDATMYTLVTFILISLTSVICILLFQILLGSMCMLKETMESIEAQNS